jgi:maltooligosyltrehalose trehalohydrolase
MLFRDGNSPPQPFLFFADLRQSWPKWFAPGARVPGAVPVLAGPGPGGAARARRPPHLPALEADLGERERHAGAYALHIDLLRLRREDPVFRIQGAGGVDGAVLGPEAFVLRFFGVGLDLDDRLLCVNLGRDLNLPSVAEPLLAPLEGTRWSLIWSSETVRYGGNGTPPLNPAEGGLLPGHAAVVFGPSR